MSAHRPVADPDRVAAHGHLMSVLADLRESGRSVPCQDPGQSWAWTLDEKDDADAEQTAANLCLSCAGVLDCKSYIETHDEEAGVWAGRTPKDRRRIARQKLKEKKA